MSRRDFAFLALGLIGAAAIFGVYRLVGSFPHSVPAGAAAPAITADAPAPTPAPTPAASGAMKVPSVEESTAKLAARLEKTGGTPADWQLLGKSYEFLGRKDDAVAAYARAGGRPADAADTGASMPSAAAMAAAARSLAGDLGGSGGGASAAPSGARVWGTIELASKLRGKDLSQAVLFVLARTAARSGPPLAVIKLTPSNWPVPFSLDDSNAMMPSLNLSGADQVVVEARLSFSGNPLAQPGDLSGSIENVNPHKAQPLHIVIDHTVK